jgi:hypothetical protein
VVSTPLLKLGETTAVHRLVFALSLPKGNPQAFALKLANPLIFNKN